MHLKVSGVDASTDRIQVQGFSRLRTRSDFEAAARGRVEGSRYGPIVMSLSQLQNPAGGYDIDIPVNPSGSSTPQGPGTFPPFPAVGDSGVFPIQVQLFSAAGVPEAPPLTTFVVYASAVGSPAGLPKLNVALVVPVRAPPSVGSRGEIGPLTAADSSRLQSLIAAIQSHQDVPLSLAVSPQTADALQSGSAADRVTAAALATLGRSGADEVLPATYARVSMDDLLGAGLGSELSAQLTAGSAGLAKLLGGSSAGSTGSTWVFDGPIDQASVGAVLARGVTHLIVPDSDLTGLPNAARQTTFALPTRLTGVGRGSGPVVYAADSLLTSDFNDSGGPALAASRLLAEMAMIQTETPGILRGVAVVPPHRWSADPQFVNTLLAGLSNHPLLQATTASGLFAAVKTAAVERGLAGSGSRGSSTGSGPQPNQVPGQGSNQGTVSGQSLQPNQPGPSNQPGTSLAPPSPGLAQDAPAIRDARKHVDAFAAVLASNDQIGDQLDDALLIAESTDVTESQRRAILHAVRTASSGGLNQVTLPLSSSITLTSTRGLVPLTILSAGGLHAHVELRLNSQRLIFRPFNPPGGSCRVPTPTSEVCELVLAGQNTTLKVPVEARSSGVFPLDISLWAPGGAFTLAKRQDTVRSTAVSGVGVILIVVAVLSLALWWGRDLRHGRRARRLVPAPSDDEPELLVDDPIVREFFEKPPPGFGGGTRTGGPRG